MAWGLFDLGGRAGGAYGPLLAALLIERIDFWVEKSNIPSLVPLEKLLEMEGDIVYIVRLPAGRASPEPYIVFGPQRKIYGLCDWIPRFEDHGSEWVAYDMDSASPYHFFPNVPPGGGREFAPVGGKPIPTRARVGMAG